MHRRLCLLRSGLLAVVMSVFGCATTEQAPPPKAPEQPVILQPADGETHLRNLHQLTFGGENAEAYWSFDGKRLTFQSRRDGAQCDRIYQMDPFAPKPQPEQLSSGEGATTCSYFLPGDEEILYASTHGGGKDCPPKPDMSLGYVWAIYDTYDIYRLNLKTKALTQLTHEKGYDAEATVCQKDGSIVFTSDRDGDIELYRMDHDGGNVKRLTHTPGYDGGAFFNQDCSKIVWRASRPKPGKELEDFQALLAKNLVRPSKLELYVANADGTEARQLTYLNAASFAPFWHPNGKRILFSSNVGDPKGREFDIWAVDVDGTNLERITTAPGFDGFPMFSPDGRHLAFSSNRATAPGEHDTNVFVAEWDDAAPVRPAEETAADRVEADIRWLADPAREGRGVGTKGLAAAGEWLEAQFKALGLLPGADGGGYRQPFPVVTSIEVGDATQLQWNGKTLKKDDVVPLGFSASGSTKGAVVFAGYGISDPAVGRDDYKGVSAKGKIVVVRRFVPDGGAFADTKAQRKYGDLRHKAWVAREHGARALVVVDLPEKPKDAAADWKLPDEARMPRTEPEGPNDAGLPVVVVKRAAAEDVVKLLEAKKPVVAALTVALTPKTTEAFNVVGRLPAGSPQDARIPGALVVGAHYDHLGMGGRNSLAPDKVAPHVGADDNASGVAAMLEVARQLKQHQAELGRDVYFVAFSGEELGVLGSTHFARTPPKGVELKALVAMLNMDMVGRMRMNTVQILGGDSAAEWSELVQPACDAVRVNCTLGGDGYGPSDQTPFYAGGVPVLHFFTGAHSEYHKPSDTADLINAAGVGAIAQVVAKVALAVDDRPQKLTYKSVPSPTPQGDLRSFNASLGTIPDYSGAPGVKGVLLAGVRPGGAADLGGMKRGDILVRLGKHEIGSVEDLMYALNASKPGEQLTAVVLRDGKETPLEVTMQESKRR